MICKRQLDDNKWINGQLLDTNMKKLLILTG